MFVLHRNDIIAYLKEKYLLIGKECLNGIWMNVSFSEQAKNIKRIDVKTVCIKIIIRERKIK